jgi:hypothetical protein
MRTHYEHKTDVHDRVLMFAEVNSGFTQQSVGSVPITLQLAMPAVSLQPVRCLTADGTSNDEKPA